MKGFSSLILGLLAAAMLIACPRVDAQQFGLSVTPSSDSALISNSLTYTIVLTNLSTGTIDTIDTVVTNFLPSSVEFQTATNYYNSSGAYLTNSVVFALNALPLGYPAQMTVTVIPTATGYITNTVVVASTDYGYTNVVSTNVVVQITNTVPAEADLGVVMTGPKQVVITNDWMTYRVTVTNSGPNSAPGVMLTNTLPPGVLLKGISPNLSYSTVTSNLIFSLGTLPDGGSTDLHFTVEPTNIATLKFSASIGAPGVTDTNTANNFASTNVTVTNYLSGPFEISTNSTQIYNPQNGLVEQSIVVTNNTNYTADAVRVIISGLTPTNALFNAVGTNNGNPFVYYSTNLVAGGSVSLLLQYAASAYFPLTNGQLQAFAVPTPNWTPPPATTTSTNININRIVELANGRMLIEWPSQTNRTYTVVYSDNVSFSNAMIAPPSIVAPANRTQWIDYGPPTTISAPTNAPVRFYRVYQNP